VVGSRPVQPPPPGGDTAPVGGAQSWAVVGPVGALLVVYRGLVERRLAAEFRGLRAELGQLRSDLDGRLAAVDARCQLVNHRLDALDRDVQALTERVFRPGAGSPDHSARVLAREKSRQDRDAVGPR
jgi:hypothetical protein